jgi:selenocysteine lyase/cysteine desulfurase
MTQSVRTAGPLFSVTGADRTVPTVQGDHVPYVNLDIAASAPALASVWAAVEELVPWYSSVHRGAGYLSGVVTELVESARATVAGFLGAPAGSEVVFTRNTTDAINLLRTSLPPGTSVVTFDSEHHANLLRRRPRRRCAPPPPGHACSPSPGRAT